jgi:uncharacterized membrane protein YfcA
MLSIGVAIFVVITVSFLAGAVASVVGFGIGSLLTPLLGLRFDLKTAVALVSIPHLLCTALRYAMLRRHVDWGVLRSFGLMSACGGLAGALAGRFLASPVLTMVLGGLLVFAGATGLSGIANLWRFRGPFAWLVGLLSGVFGGLVGNQGGIRSAALLGFDLPRQAFVATATAVGLLVDGARMPIYFAGQLPEIMAAWPYVAAASLGSLAGTVSGERLLRRIPEPLFRKVVLGIVLLLGIALIVAGTRSLLAARG